MVRVFAPSVVDGVPDASGGAPVEEGCDAQVAGDMAHIGDGCCCDRARPGRGVHEFVAPDRVGTWVDDRQRRAGDLGEDCDVEERSGGFVVTEGDRVDLSQPCDQYRVVIVYPTDSVDDLKHNASDEFFRSGNRLVRYDGQPAE